MAHSLHVTILRKERDTTLPEKLQGSGRHPGMGRAWMPVLAEGRARRTGWK